MKTRKVVFPFLLFFLFYNQLVFSQFTFVHITDLHVCDHTTFGNTGNYDMDGAMLECCLKQFRSLDPKPAFVVVSGDISNIGMIGSTDGMYGALTRHLFPAPITYPRPGAYYIDSALTIPVFFVAGNHEYYQLIVPPIVKTVPQFYINNIAPDSDYRITFNNTLLLFLRTDGDRPITQDPNPLNGVESKGITSAQCQWLRQALQGAGNKRKIIVMHNPVVNANGTNVDGSATTSINQIDASCFLNNRETFLNICDSNQVDVVLCGHVHQNVVINRAGTVVDENWTNATRYVQTGEAFHGGYRLITVDSSFVNVHRPQRVDCVTAGMDLYAKPNVSLAPNPFSDETVLTVTSTDDIVKLEIRIYDIRGCEVQKLSGESNSPLTINKGSLLPGLYFYRIYSGAGLLQSGKVVICE